MSGNTGRIATVKMMKKEKKNFKYSIFNTNIGYEIYFPVIYDEYHQSFLYFQQKSNVSQKLYSLNYDFI